MFTSQEIAARRQKVNTNRTRIEHFGRAPRGAPVVLGHGARGGFPHRTEAHKCCRVYLSAYPAAAPTTFPARGPPCSRSSPTCFRERHNVKEKSDGFPAVQTAQLFAPPDKTGQNLPATKLPWRESYSSAVAFPGPHLPGVIRPPIPADHGLPLARFKAFKAVQATTDIRLTGSLLVGKIGSPLL